MSWAHGLSAVGRLIGGSAASVFAYASYRNMETMTRMEQSIEKYANADEKLMASAANLTDRLESIGRITEDVATEGLQFVRENKAALETILDELGQKNPKNR